MHLAVNERERDSDAHRVRLKVKLTSSAFAREVIRVQRRRITRRTSLLRYSIR